MLEQVTQSLWLMIVLTKQNWKTLAIITAILYGIAILNALLGRRLLWLGIIPRTSWGLVGIFFSPFLHANFDHLFFNSIPFLVLSNFILMRGLHYYLLVSAEIAIISGFLVWLFAKPGIHVGASGVITGYWALLVMQGVWQSSLVTLLMAGVCLYYFAGIFLGIFPSVRKGISWESHLFGLIAGVVAAYLGPLQLAIFS